MKNFIFLIIGLAVIIGSIILFLQSPRTRGQEVSTLKIGGTEVRVEIADSDRERSLGLSGREILEPGSGMLFVFDAPGLYGFWMNDMKFPIDIIWINEEALVVWIERNVRPETYPNKFAPPEPAKYVLEVPAGFADLHKITIGSVVQ